MSSAATIATIAEVKLLRPILVGGAIAGTLDQISAFISLGWNVPRVDAAGLLGLRVIHGNQVWVWVFGLSLHYLIAFSAAAIYCLASLKLSFLKDHFLICGMFYGVAVFLVMYLVVMPLCAFRYRGPYTLHTLLEGILVHILLIGSPISLSLRKL